MINLTEICRLLGKKSKKKKRESEGRRGLFVYIYCVILEKDMATHCSALAWRIPQTEEPGGLPSMGSHRVRHD